MMSASRRAKKQIIWKVLVLTTSFLFSANGLANTAPPSTGRLVNDLRQMEAAIKNDPPDPRYFSYTEGTIPILISAPHGAKHFRKSENRLKCEDAYTASMAIELGRITGAHVLYTRSQAPEDPNNDYRTEYKDFLARVVREKGIRFVMDLHGSHGRRPFTIDVGTFTSDSETCSCPVLLATIRRALRTVDGVRFNSRFCAHGRGTVTSFARLELHINAAQFEINGRYRIPHVDPAAPNKVTNEREIATTMDGLREVICEISEVLRGTPSVRPS